MEDSASPSLLEGEEDWALPAGPLCLSQLSKLWSKETGWSVVCRAPPEYLREWVLHSIIYIFRKESNRHYTKYAKRSPIKQSYEADVGR